MRMTKYTRTNSMLTIQITGSSVYFLKKQSENSLQFVTLSSRILSDSDMDFTYNGISPFS